MKCNIVMLVKDRPKLTNQALRSLYSNTDPSLYDLTIIDDGSQGPYLPARDFALLGRPENTTMLTITNSKNITGQARNLGVYFAEKYWGRGDFLLLLDNDLFMTQGWLETLIAAFNLVEVTRQCKLLGGWNHPFLQPAPGTPIMAEWAAGRIPGFQYKEHDAVAGACQLMRWKTWDAFGPLDSHSPGVGQSEDFKFSQDIIKAGGKVGSLYPRCVYNTGLTNSFGQPSPGSDVMLKELQEAKRKFPDLYWE
jgi:GT2 family glycosyltransferase